MKNDKKVISLRVLTAMLAISLVAVCSLGAVQANSCFDYLNLEYSTDLSTWQHVLGSYPAYIIPLDPSIQYYYIDVASAAPDTDDDYYPFYLDTGSVPSDFYTYWQNRGVFSGCGGTWQPIMWQIITGNQPMFYLKVSGGSTYMLVDGLQKLLYGTDQHLRVNGDYPQGAYTFTGYIEREDVVCNTTVKMTFADPQELVPVFTPVGIIALLGILSVVLAGATIKKRKSN